MLGLDGKFLSQWSHTYKRRVKNFAELSIQEIYKEYPIMNTSAMLVRVCHLDDLISLCTLWWIRDFQLRFSVFEQYNMTRNWCGEAIKAHFDTVIAFDLSCTLSVSAPGTYETNIVCLNYKAKKFLDYQRFRSLSWKTSKVFQARMANFKS